MNYRTNILIIFLLQLLPGCYSTSTESSTKHTYLIQAPFNVAIISQIQDTMSPIIDKVIEEEAGLKPDIKTPLFFFKKRAAVTVYYVNDMYVNAEPILFSSLKDIENLSAPQNVSISTKVDFFGEPKDELMALMDLVVFIDDPNKDLSLLNKEAKKLVHAANEQYKNRYHIDMYDIAKSERHAYLPHLSIGHLRVNYIKHLIKDASRAEKAIENIKQRIMKTTMQTLSELPLESKKIVIDKLSIYDLQKRIYIKDYSLKP